MVVVTKSVVGGPGIKPGLNNGYGGARFAYRGNLVEVLQRVVDGRLQVRCDKKSGPTPGQ